MKAKPIVAVLQKCLLPVMRLALMAFILGAGQSARAALIVTLSIPGAVPWTDTGIDIPSGSQLTVSALGTIQYGPLGLQNRDANGGDYDGTLYYPSTVYPDTIVVSLIGKIGGTTEIGTGTPVPEGTPGHGLGFVGVSYNQLIGVGGRLFLGYNDIIGLFIDNHGSFDVTLTVDPIPEPSSMALVVLGASISGWFLRRRRKS